MKPMARMRSPIGRHVMALLLLVIGFCANSSVSAQTFDDCRVSFTTSKVEKTINVPNPLRVPADAPVGTVLFSQTVPFSDRNSLATCNGATSSLLLGVTNSPTGSVYQTVPGLSPTTLVAGYLGSGLGVRYYVDDQPAMQPYSVKGKPLVGTFWNLSAPGVLYPPAQSWRVEVVKTEMQPTNPITNLYLGMVELIAGRHPTTGASGYTNSVRILTIQPPTTTGGFTQVIWPAAACDIVTNDLTIAMGNWDADQLDQDIATPLSAPQNIELNCPANPGITMTVSGTVVPGTAAPNIFALTPGLNTANNVGVQFFINNDANIAVRTDMSYPIMGAAGTVDVPVQARYFKVGGKPTPGTANSSITATFTFN